MMIFSYEKYFNTDSFLEKSLKIESAFESLQDYEKYLNLIFTVFCEFYYHCYY